MRRDAGGRGEDRLRHGGRAVAAVKAKIVAALPVAEHALVEPEGAVEQTRVGIDEQLAGVEPVPLGRREGAVRAKAVAGALPYPFD